MFKRFGTMVDCSRNAVPKVSTLKKWMDITSDLGYNSLFLYMEDTYEVEGHPYFGYGRGRYSEKELKEIDSYAKNKNMEVIPCIQTLAHLNGIFHWKEYLEFRDCDEILLSGDDRTYELIDKMFASLSRCLTSKNVNIGLDEAHMIGKGKYFDIHGAENRLDIMIKHINRVSEIAKKYGFTLTMWSDMFYRLIAGGDYYNIDLKFDSSIKELIPDNVELVYWDYYSSDEERYEKMITSHKKLSDNIWFAGGLWKWSGFAPSNKFSIAANRAALKKCAEHNVENVMLTLWGDDGAECSLFSTLPSLYYSAEFAKGNYDEEKINQGFENKFGISMNDFLLADLTGGSDRTNPSKYILYNDLLFGLMDTTIDSKVTDDYKALSEKLCTLTENLEWGYIFDCFKKLCDVIALKAEMGIKLREAYKAKDKKELSRLCFECVQLKDKVEIFYEAFKKQWFSENKPFGFEIQDIRIGGVIKRIEHCISRVNQYLAGEIDIIDEFEETLLDITGQAENGTKRYIMYNNYVYNASPNVVGHNIIHM